MYMFNFQVELDKLDFFGPRLKFLIVDNQSWYFSIIQTAIEYIIKPIYKNIIICILFHTAIDQLMCQYENTERKTHTNWN